MLTRISRQDLWASLEKEIIVDTDRKMYRLRRRRCRRTEMMNGMRKS